MAPTNRERAAASHHRGRGMWHISNLHDVDNEKRSQIVRISQAMMQTIKNKTIQKKKALRMRILSTRSCVRLETSLTVRDETKRNGRFKPSAAGQHRIGHHDFQQYWWRECYDIPQQFLPDTQQSSKREIFSRPSIYNLLQ